MNKKQRWTLQTATHSRDVEASLRTTRTYMPCIITARGVYIQHSNTVEVNAPTTVDVNAPTTVDVNAPIAVDVTAPIAVEVNAPIAVEVNAPTVAEVFEQLRINTDVVQRQGHTGLVDVQTVIQKLSNAETAMFMRLLQQMGKSELHDNSFTNDMATLATDNTTPHGFKRGIQQLLTTYEESFQLTDEFYTKSMLDPADWQTKTAKVTCSAPLICMKSGTLLVEAAIPLMGAIYRLLVVANYVAVVAWIGALLAWVTGKKPLC
jgi:hypothetical protein